MMLIFDWNKQRDWSIQAFRKGVWHAHPSLAQNLLTVFILLKPEYDRQVSRYNGISPFTFFESNESLLHTILEQRDPNTLPDLCALSETALQSLNLLLPVDTLLTRSILSETGKLFWPSFFADKHHSDRRQDFRDTEQEQAYLKWLAEYLLCSELKDQHEIVQELSSYLATSDMTNDLLTQIILLQDQLMKSQSFWNLWSELFEIVEGLCSKEKDRLPRVRERNIDQYYGGKLDEILTTYLLAFPWWRDDAKSWHTLRKKDADFFSKASVKLGYHPGTLYSIARILNSIGYDYLDEGIKWLAVIVKNNSHLCISSLQVNTEYYIEEYVQRFIATKRTSIRHSPELRRDMLDVLNFLVDRGSTCGFMLRESLCYVLKTTKFRSGSIMYI